MPNYQQYSEEYHPVQSIYLILMKLAQLYNSKFFISLNLRSGYYHIKLSPKTRYKSACTTIFGRYKYLTMLFRLAQGPVNFTALMQKVFGQFNDFLCRFLILLYNLPFGRFSWTEHLLLKTSFHPANAQRTSCSANWTLWGQPFLEEI